MAVFVNGPNKSTIGISEDNRLYIKQYQGGVTDCAVDLGFASKEAIDEIIRNLKRLKTHC